MKKYLLSLLAFLALVWGAAPVAAFSPGMHILRPDEIESIISHFSPVRRPDQPIYVTIPFTLDDRAKLPQWQLAFDLAREHNVVPIVRLATRYDSEQDAWEIPTRKDIVDLSSSLNKLEWPQQQRIVIFFNEPNHAKEWGGEIDPLQFAEVTSFALDWFSTEKHPYVMLPAALDLAAPNGKQTKEAFGYWREVLSARPEIVEKISAWNSHSYPNPGFAASPARTGKNSLRGFESELAFISHYTERELDVYITETGWDTTARLAPRLSSYYLTAAKTIWNNPRVVAVTPFVFAGSPGPFAGFSFIDEGGRPTTQWKAFASALAVIGSQLVTDQGVRISPQHQ